MDKIIFATGNEHKMIEIRAILSDLGVEILSQKEAGIKADVIEDGMTFEENAMIKATESAKIAHEMPEYAHAVVLADDSGLEIDYLNEASNPSIARFRELPLDYRIGSVHLLYNDKGEVVDVDVPADTFKTIVDGHFCGDLEHVVRLYYGRLTRMLELGGFDIVGHADKMHYNAACYRPGLLDEPWYDELVRAYFADIARRGYQVEVNTKAYHDLGTFYPNERYFSYLHDLGVRVQVNSDSHYPERINNGRPEALRALRKAGYESVMELHGGEWKEMPIVF